MPAGLSSNFLNPYSTFYSGYKDSFLNISSQSASVYKTNASLASAVVITDTDAKARKSVLNTKGLNNYMILNKEKPSYPILLPPPSSIDEI